MSSVSGSCLCGSVAFECFDQFDMFHLCYCEQCQKASGTAHGANLFTSPTNIYWLKGQDRVKRYDVPGRTISSAFCSDCGSPVPYVSLSGKYLVVPAGSLDNPSETQPQRQIFWSEKASWYEEGVRTPRCKTID